jgi:peptidoglycan/xylan/chitin deacetylase (PgdA/CDA1 family)
MALALAAVSLAAMALVGVVAVQPAGASDRTPPLVFSHVHTHQKLVALTFDDGPDPRWTPTVLRLLAEHGAHATFFEIGDNATAHPDLVAQVLAAGDEIGNHTLDHAHLPDLSTPQIRSELKAGGNALVAAGAPRPHYFRPPIGLTDSRVRTVAAEQHLRTVFWDLCVEHYVNHTDVAAGTDALLAKVGPGTIILGHDGGIPDRSRTMESLPRLLDGLTKRGYRIVSVSQLEATRSRPPG